MFAAFIIWGSITLGVEGRAFTLPEKSGCTPGELRAKDCRLRLGEYKIDLLEQTLAWNDGMWHAVNPMPVTGEGVTWENVKFERAGKRVLLQLWLWDKAVGEAQVQSLRWYVMSLGDRKLSTLADGVVRKRHAETQLSEAKPTKEQKFLYDAPEKHGLKSLNNCEF